MSSTTDLPYTACSSASARTEMIQQIPDKRCRVIELLQLESLLTRTNQLIFSSRGGKYHSEDDDFTLTVPEGAVPTGDSISIQFGVVAYGPVGPFKYPYGVRPVSPIVWLCSTPKFEFQKPIEVSLPHCLDCNDEDDCRSLTFLKADHTANQDSKLFHFELTDGKVSFALNTSYGTLSTTHFCMYCVGEYTREDTDKALYCVVVARPLRMEKISQVYFCLTYFLRTCLKVRCISHSERLRCVLLLPQLSYMIHACNILARNLQSQPFSHNAMHPHFPKVGSMNITTKALGAYM